MKFDRLIEEVLDKQDKLNALMSLKTKKESTPPLYRRYVDKLIDEYSLEELKSMLAMELRMYSKYDSSNSQTRNALRYAIAELE